jgi:hypothetical protein
MGFESPPTFACQTLVVMPRDDEKYFFISAKRIYLLLAIIATIVILLHLYDILNRTVLNPGSTIDIHKLISSIVYLLGWGCFICGLICLKLYLDGNKKASKTVLALNIVLVCYSTYLFILFSVLSSTPLDQWIFGPFRRITILALSATATLVLSRLTIAKNIHNWSISDKTKTA